MLDYLDVKYNGHTVGKYHYTESDQFSKLANDLPGVREHVSLPCECVNKPVFSRKVTLRNAIIHLNDKDRWTRDQIADWLESLDIDLRFKPTKEESTI
jgi:hypothetical protein